MLWSEMTSGNARVPGRPSTTWLIMINKSSSGICCPRESKASLSSSMQIVPLPVDFTPVSKDATQLDCESKRKNPNMCGYDLLKSMRAINNLHQVRSQSAIWPSWVHIAWGGVKACMQSSRWGDGDSVASPYDLTVFIKLWKCPSAHVYFVCCQVGSHRSLVFGNLLTHNEGHLRLYWRIIR